MSFVYLSDAMHGFITNQPYRFGKVNRLNQGHNLIASLNWAEAGYIDRFAADKLIYIYVKHQNLLDDGHIIPDNYMRTFFGGNIPALYYLYRNPAGRRNKIFMTDAVAQGLIDRPMNTFEVLQNEFPEFDPNRIPTVFSMWLVALNALTEEVLSNNQHIEHYREIYANLNNPLVREILTKEAVVIDNTAVAWQA